MATSYGINNTFLTPDVIAREALLILEHNIVSPQLMTTSATADFTGAKVGDTINLVVHRKNKELEIPVYLKRGI